MEQVKFSQQLADEICRRIVGGQSLASICDEEGMPSTSTVMYWRHTKPDFKAQYEASREAQADAIFEELLEIADDGSNDWMEVQSAKGKIDIVLDKEHVQRSRVRIDTRFRMLEKMNSKRYGAKVELDHRSGDGTMSPKNMNDQQKADKIAAILARAEAKRSKSKVDDGTDLV